MNDLSRTCESLRFNSESTNGRALKNWKLIKNMIRASNSFKSQEVQIVNDIDQFIDDLSTESPKKCLKKSKTVTSSAIENHKNTDLLFFYIKRSSNADIDAIKYLIEIHPLKYVRSCTDANSFVNKPDVYGIRPLYEAVRNGYSETVQVLLDSGANPHLDSNGENCLQVACRWNHIIVVKCLMNSTQWTKNEIKLALKETKNPVLVGYLKGCLKSSSIWCGCS